MLNISKMPHKTNGIWGVAQDDYSTVEDWFLKKAKAGCP